MAKNKFLFSSEAHERKTLLLGIYAPGNQVTDMESYYEEFLGLVDTLGIAYDHTLFIKLRSTDKGHFLSKGKLQDLVDYCEEHAIEYVVCSETLTPLQERNLSDLLHAEILDRTGLILEIFRNAAHSAEGKTQVEMAELDYLKARLAGRGKELAQQAGTIGEKGPGETTKEILRRTYAEKMRQARKRLEMLEKNRNVQRAKRLESNVPLVCIVGYTNAGKSSLLNRLTKSGVLVEDKLFATLDTTVRTLYLDSEKKILISDTVGFISQLPHQLIEAFKSTLDELRYANLLMLVVDSSNPMWRDQIEIVHQILDELQLDKPILYVFNKMDLIEDKAALDFEMHQYEPHVAISTVTKDGITELVDYLKKTLFKKPTKKK